MTVLGIDIGGTRIKTGLVGADGAIVVERAVRTPDTVDGFRTVLGETLELGAAQAAGIGCKGIVDAADTRIVALPGTLHFLEGHYLRDLMPPGVRVAGGTAVWVWAAGACG